MIREGRSFSGKERHCCYLNTGASRFANVSAATGLDLIDDGRAAGVVDMDQDGDLDLWVANRTGPRIRFLQNQLDQAAGYLALRLIGNGSTCNRDAIGARVELTVIDAGTPTKHIRTVKSGSGFLSQSSKWLHFGLGDSQTVGRLSIQWPDGAVDTFDRVTADQHYEVRQGQPELMPRQAPTSDPPIAEVSPGPSDDAAQRVRIVVAQALPLPDLNYHDLDGNEHNFTEQRSVTLLNLWATWCAPCLQELTELSQATDRLQAAGIDVVALNVGDTDGTADALATREQTTKLNLPFRVGLANRSLVEQLDVVQRTIISLQRSLPLPSSFLIDSRQQVRAIYFGTVDVDQLIVDAKKLTNQPIVPDNFVTPLPGRWISRPPGIRPLSVAMKFIEAGMFAEAKSYLETSVSRHPAGDRRSLVDMYHVLATLLVEQGKRADAINVLLDGLKSDPQHGPSRFDLGVLRYEMGNFSDARKQFQAALAAQPENAADLWNKIGLTWIHEGRFEEAVQAFQASLAADSDRLSTLLNMADAQQRLHRYGQAISYLKRIVQQDPGNPQLQFQLGSLHVRNNDIQSALQAFQEAHQRAPQWHLVTNNIAWILATNEDPEIRDPDQAVQMAESVCDATNYQDASALDTLAVAYAAAERFADSQKVLQQALSLLPPESEKQRQQLQQRLEKLQAEHPLNAP